MDSELNEKERKADYDESMAYDRARDEGIVKTGDNRYNKELLEKLAELEHQQWWKMRKSLFEKIEKQFTEITGCSNPYCQNYPAKEGEWNKLRDHIEYRPYAELSEEVKEHDRKWARKVLDIINEGQK